MVLVGALDRVRDGRTEPLFVVKGGVSLELRLRIGARATKDFDTFFRESAETMLHRLDEGLRQPYGDFRFERTEPEAVGATGARRLEVQVIYLNRVWQRVVMEMVQAEGRMADATEIERVPAIASATLGSPAPPT